MTSIDDKNKNSTAAFVMLLIMFFLWGIANNMTGTLLQNFRHIIHMSDLQEGVIKSAFYVAYFFAALPAVYYLYRKRSYKNCILVGLMLYAIGALMFFPAASMESYFFYLVAIYVMATGCAALETVANTYIVAAAPTHDKGVWRLNLAQSFNPLGSVLGILLCQWLIIDNLNNQDGAAANTEIIREELDAITMLYAGVGEVLLVILVMAIFVSIRSIQSVMIVRKPIDLWQSIIRLMRIPTFRRGAMAIFVYVGAQTCVWGFTIPVINEQDGEYDAVFLYTCSMAVFAVSRFLFTWLMKYFRYQRLLLFAAITALVFCLVVIFLDGVFVITSLIMLSCCMSLMFATIFGMSLENTGRDTQTGGTILVMMIVGGGLLPPLQSVLAKTLSAQMSFILPAVCFLMLVMYSSFVLLLYDKKSNV